ncbi:hypothetical protein [Streptomyces sp. x-80]|uniref:hypothetical protein n=1 Tax=Streptomyces sp. x-80 TaxID=2789282 RepID=UPI00397F9193
MHACLDKSHRPAWRVVVRNANYSAFNGYRRAPSPYSLLRCLECGAAWRTKAAYVTSIQDADMQPTALRESAAAHEEAARESIEASDTEGFLSQWAHGVCAREDRLAAHIAENGGTAEFPALFDLDGTLVPARRVQKQYGWIWELLDAKGGRRGWFNESRAKSPEVRRRNNATKGIYLGTVRAPAESATVEGEVRGLAVIPVRTDGGWSPDVQVIDNGH